MTKNLKFYVWEKVIIEIRVSIRAEIKDCDFNNLSIKYKSIKLNILNIMINKIFDRA